jgi:hypothetical protein
MSKWLVTAIPSWLLLAGLIVVISGSAVLIQKYVRRRFPALTGEDHNDVTRFTYGFIGFLYAFFIGFVVSSMWSQINTSDGNARAEGAAAVQMATDAVVFDTADRDRVRQALLTYEQAAVAEWTHNDLNRSPDADAALARVYTAYGQVQANTDPQKTRLATSYSNLDKISQARTVRILAAREDTGPPWPFWVIIFLTSAMVLGTVIIYGVERPHLHYSMVAIVGLIVAANLFLVLQLAHPFFGEVSTSSDPLHEAVWVLSQPVA